MKKKESKGKGIRMNELQSGKGAPLEWKEGCCGAWSPEKVAVVLCPPLGAENAMEVAVPPSKKGWDSER